MHSKDPIPDAQKTDISYHLKCPANSCTAEYIGETNRSLKESFRPYKSNHQCHQNHHISTKHPKAELKDFTKLDRDSNTLHHWAKRSTSHSYQRSITQKHWQSQNPFSIQQTSQTSHTIKTSTYFYPPTHRGIFFTWSLNTKDNLHFTPSWFPSTIEVYHYVHTLKLQDNWIFRSSPSRKHIEKQFLHIRKCHLLQKVFKFQVLWSSHQSSNKAEEGTS